MLPLWVGGAQVPAGNWTGVSPW